ncbi:uncharacterized protein LOC132935260 [Metopolophium dirhodum]|uniref:uncharacterized protein LOC132935260 n=1 Tax=Metopolophium dirhodum TaxID=44670 RepID=UPI00298F6B24|nr:uncharacterized protein LOC132935260 [Metopolophium dirhodum]
MAKPKTNRDIKYARRLKELKKKFKPYRDSRSVNLLRVITGKFLKKYWESLESVLTGQYSLGVVKRRIQRVVNLVLKNGEYTVREAPSNSIEHSMVSKQFIHLHIDSKANVSDNVIHVEIDSKANEFDNVKHVNNDSRSGMFARDNVLGNETHGNINSNLNVFDNANVINSLRHLHI